MDLNAHIPSGPIQDKWSKRRFEMKLVNPANKRRFDVIVVGTGLAGASAAATMAELGYRVKVFTYHDSARRAHSIAAQGGINAAKNYQNDGDSVFRLFYDTVKGGDFRSREPNVYRLAELSLNIIDQAVAQGVPFAREYGGLLANRSFGGAQVSRTFYARGQTGQQLLLGAYQALEHQVGAGAVSLYTRHEMLDLVVVDGVARGIVTRDLVSGKIESWAGDAVVLATGGYANVFFLSTMAKACNVTATWRAHKRGAGFANPCFTQIHPTCIPPSRDIASRRAKEMVDAGHGVGPLKNGVYLDFADAIGRLGQEAISERYGNLFAMYEKITGEDPYRTPMRIYPAPHYTMGGLWVDYDLMSTVPGLFVIGEANFSDHGANRLGASALMQGLADGYFVMPLTIGNYLARLSDQRVDHAHAAFTDVEREVKERNDRLMSANGSRTVDSFHQELGRLMWEHCGMARSRDGLTEALNRIPELRQEFWRDVRVPGSGATLNHSLEKAGRLADFMEFAELMCQDALARDESCGAHYRVEHTTEDGEARRDDDRFAFVSVWEFQGVGEKPALYKERLQFEHVPLSQRSYK
jgi:succinate dehydrogenase / fumarate reductase flavoprotein subunit